VVVSKVQASLGLTVSPQPVVVGQTVSANASVVGFEPTGTLTVRRFEPSDVSCSNPVATDVFAVRGDGPYKIEFRATRAGKWLVTMSYSGDAANSGVVDSCGFRGIEVAKAVPDLRLIADPASARSRDTVSARLELRGGYQPTGRVEFRLFGPAAGDCTGTPAYVEEGRLVDGVARTEIGFQLPKQASGTWNWTAGYDGDADNAAGTSRCGEASVTVDDPGVEPQHTFVRFASNTSSVAYSGLPSSVAGGPPPTKLGQAQVVCLSAADCPPGATNYGSPFGGFWTSELSSIPGAAWIWRPGITGDTPGADFDEVVFSTTIVLTGKPTDAWIAAAADDYAEIRVNGRLVGSIGDAGPAYGTLTRFELGEFVKAGTTTISVLARNGPWCGTCPFSQNPAGVVFGGAITVG